MASLIQSSEKDGPENPIAADKIIMKTGESKNAAFLEKVCRALIQLQRELNYNINLRLALETLFLKMRGAV